MHEMPIVLNVVRTLDYLVEEKNLPPDIRVVVMEIGELASVLPNYFEKCWSPAIERSKHLKNTELKIELIPGIARCKHCGTEFHIEQNQGLCPECKIWDWDTVSGREVNIKEILV